LQLRFREREPGDFQIDPVQIARLAALLGHRREASHQASSMPPESRERACLVIIRKRG
jgi:hypothetical protein